MIKPSSLLHTFKRLIVCPEGLAIIEFAFVMPLLLLMGIGAYEVNRFINVNQRLESVAFQMADIITSNRSLSNPQLAALLSSKDQMFKPYDATGLEIIATDIYKPEGETPVARGQVSAPDGLSGSLVSGGAGQPVNIAYDMVDRDQLVAIEVFYTYRTLLGIQLTDPFLGTEQLYKRAIARLRFGANLDMN